MMSKFKLSIILLLLCASVMPLTVSGGRGSGGGGNGGGVRPPSGGGGRPGGGGGRPPSGGGTPKPSQPIARPNYPTMGPPGINQPTARPPVATFTRPIQTGGISFTRSIVTSFSFSRSSWTGISITRTIVTSYTFNPTFTWTTTSSWPSYIGGYYNGYYNGFIQYPPSYDTQVGAFTLDQTLNNQNGVACLYYTYFTFNAYAGQQLRAQVWTQGQPINYVIIPTSMGSILKQNGCSGALGQSQSFSSQTTVDWTAAQAGQYAIVFYSTVPYNGPVYFQPG